MGQYSSYDVLRGIEQVIVFYVVISTALLGILSLQLYKSLQAQDSSLERGAKQDIRAQTLLIVKRAILWVFGYKGEEREKTSFKEVDLEWVTRNRSSIVLRLIPVYGLYILALVVLTRPVFFDGKQYSAFNYSKNLYDLAIMFLIYVTSNVLFDYLSLKYTFSYVMRSLEGKRYASNFLKNALIAVLLFVLSQVVSCLLWIYKRQDPSFPKFDQGIAYSFLEIALWPYAFVTGPAGSAQIVSAVFPGQLFITGTVFIPTIMLVSLFILFSCFLKLTESIKKLLLSHRLDKFCRIFLLVTLVGVLDPKKVRTFGYCNLAFLVLFNLSLAVGARAAIARWF
jgi:hypothetical protein